MTKNDWVIEEQKFKLLQRNNEEYRIAFWDYKVYVNKVSGNLRELYYRISIKKSISNPKI